MTSAQVVETSVKVTTNSPSQDYTHADDHNLRTYDMTPGFKTFTILPTGVLPRTLLHVLPVQMVFCGSLAVSIRTTCSTGRSCRFDSCHENLDFNFPSMPVLL